MLDDKSLKDKVRKCISYLLKRNFKIVLAESCTGGLLSFLFTSIPGASKILDTSFVTYSNESKINVLNVDRNIIYKFGAVSMEVSRLMAIGALNISSLANISISITGFADSYQDICEEGLIYKDELVGLVYISCITPNNERTIKFNFGKISRYKIQMNAANAAIDCIISMI
ncbi:CinA family protein [Neoehrlichia mikurensis]|uniref:CinA family protein n=1 Tax=Neoehrlichia mikurensis TaxID=89586 RepID=A0A9Q9BYQ8_9RICK|nr:CinA family protein [Neoehrlichia mikurensis]QXK92339.1 CinA family protein [Neoehrlichia mikurensis]QXK92793.1 CinA family protein [Neoehrlichia mikurensis]QXK94034.1 CinA family protein [Neoehrlichia mikurensis]UTO55801.1 CinA family protein [Neoehrlichia mikurensis]UTO56715.1 CinA family protein [Neoehrlichia mikurensis]